MPVKRRHILVCALLIASGLICAQARADKIVLKDGTVETTERVWESEHYVHFILKGTRDVEIRYLKQIVERIERRQDTARTAKKISIEPPASPEIKIEGSAAPAVTAKPTRPVVPQPSTAAKAPTVPVPRPPATPAVKPPAMPVAKPPAHAPVSDQTLEAHQRLAHKNKGQNFYDPRRPMRYWAMRNSKHELLASALDAIAKQYGRTAKWVESHMGQENDLGEIHKNLAGQFRKEVRPEVQSGAPVSATPVETPPAEVKGVEEKGAEDKGAEDPPTIKTPAAGMPAPAAASARVSSRPGEASGIPFYDPRRDERYWSSKTAHHHTLEAALNALAQQYGVTPDWIETHMGDANDLSVIHQKIQENLK